jgi:hypothetical protein
VGLNILVGFGGVLAVAFDLVIKELPIVDCAVFEGDLALTVLLVVFEVALVHELTFFLQAAQPVELFVSELALVDLVLVLRDVFALYD